MARYPLSHNAGKPLSEFFYDILTFHVPPGPEVAILDPTCGKRHLWEHFNHKSLMTGKRLIENYGLVVFADIDDLDTVDVQSDFRDLETTLPEHDLPIKYDCIPFDPPYLYGYEGSDDPRREDYGDYSQGFLELLTLIRDSAEILPRLLRPGGKIILKCSDQYDVVKRKFTPLHIMWNDFYTNNKLELIDFFVFVHHRMSPTAFQVKDRPCSVIMHTYFMVYQYNDESEWS